MTPDEILRYLRDEFGPKNVQLRMRKVYDTYEESKAEGARPTIPYYELSVKLTTEPWTYFNASSRRASAVLQEAAHWLS